MNPCNFVDATYLFNQLKINLSEKEIASYLNLHEGTIKRWSLLNKVPNNYFQDLNHYFNYKYQDNSPNSFRIKDEFYTKKEIAIYCYKILLENLNKLNINYKNYYFIEPSVGNKCSFFDLLPENRKIGIDIKNIKNEEINEKIIKENYLYFLPNKTNKYIVLGNPPFGLRGNLALRFINHSSKFADIVAFILPKLFNSDGKGTPKKRVKDYSLAYSIDLPLDSFEYPDNTPVEVATVFQIWTKINKNRIELKTNINSCKSFLRVYSLSDGGTPSSTRNKKMINKCDVYLPSTCFNNMKAFRSFEELPHKRGYGVVIYKEKERIKDIMFNEINWKEVAFLSTNSALNLRTSLIENVIIERGFIDEQ